MSIKFSIIITTILIFLFKFSVFAQETEKNSNSEWLQIESENKEISFAMPENFSFVFNKEGFSQYNPRKTNENAFFKKVRSLTAYQNGATIFFESYELKYAKQAMPFLLANFPNTPVNYISFENFSGLQLMSDKDVYSEFYYFASENNVYFIGAASREKVNKTKSEFLNSIKLNNKNIINIEGGKINKFDKHLSIVSLSETPFDIEFNLKKEEKQKIEQEEKDAKSAPKTPPDNKGVIVLVKPRAMYTDEARQNQEQGVIRFRVDFSANGKIENVRVIKKLRYGITEEAINL